MSAPNGVTIVVPCYNEAARLACDEFRPLLDEGHSLLFVDDGSSDQTRLILEAFVERVERASVLILGKNRGKGEAVRAGMSEAILGGAAIVGYLDADLSTPAPEALRLIELLDGESNVEAVLGSRVAMLGRSIDRSPTRHYQGRVFATLASWTLRMPVYDTQCGAKVFRVTDSLRAALNQPFTSRWVFDVELLARLRYDEPVTAASAIVEEPLRQWTDQAGSHLSWTARFEAIGDLITIRRRIRRQAHS